MKIHFPEDVISLDTPKHQKYQSFTSTYNYPDEKGDYFFIAFNTTHYPDEKGDYFFIAFNTTT